MPTIDPGVVDRISSSNHEPRWMNRIRRRGLAAFRQPPRPGPGAPDLPDIELGDTPGPARRRQRRSELAAVGIVFCDLATAVRDHAALVRQCFATVVAPDDNAIAALNTAMWSGGTFVYVPPGVKCEVPLQTDLRAESERPGRFDRTLIVAGEGSSVHYVEGCSAPVYTGDPLRSSVVEIVVGRGARVTCTTTQNWSTNVHHHTVKRARVEAGGRLEWADGMVGSGHAVAHPSVHLVGEGATGAVLSVASAGPGQRHDVGAEFLHAASHTRSRIVSRSVSQHGGITTSRGLVRIADGASECHSRVDCDALLLDGHSVGTTVRCLDTGRRDARLDCEARRSTIADEQLFYLMSRGLSRARAVGAIIAGFVEPVTGELPKEYAVEWTRLIELQLEGVVG